MSIFTLALVLLITLNLGVLLGFWLFATLREDTDDHEGDRYVGPRPLPRELFEESSL